MDAEISLPDGILLRSIRDTDAAALAEAYRAERTHLEPWEPRRDERFFTAIRQRELIGRELDAAASGTALGLVLVAGEQVHPDALTGDPAASPSRHAAAEPLRRGRCRP